MLEVHELSLIAELMDILGTSAGENGIVRIRKVRLVVGESHQALPEALETAFTVLGAGSPAEGAVLEIAPVATVFRCRECGHEYGGDGWLAPCPACGSFQRALIRGNELYVDYYEGETEEDLACG